MVANMSHNHVTPLSFPFFLSAKATYFYLFESKQNQLLENRHILKNQSININLSLV